MRQPRKLWNIESECIFAVLTPRSVPTPSCRYVLLEFIESEREYVRRVQIAFEVSLPLSRSAHGVLTENFIGLLFAYQVWSL